jgi:hypothetical protein
MPAQQRPRVETQVRGPLRRSQPMHNPNQRKERVQRKQRRQGMSAHGDRRHVTPLWVTVELRRNNLHTAYSTRQGVLLMTMTCWCDCHCIPCSSSVCVTGWVACQHQGRVDVCTSSPHYPSKPYTHCHTLTRPSTSSSQGVLHANHARSVWQWLLARQKLSYMRVGDHLHGCKHNNTCTPVT